MTLQDVIDQLNLTVLTQPVDFAGVTPAAGYTSDLLSCVMAKARAGDVWVTLQAHPNVVAVASLLELAAVIVTEGVVPDVETVHKAHEEGVTLLTTTKTTFAVAGELTRLGVEASSPG